MLTTAGFELFQVGGVLNQALESADIYDTGTGTWSSVGGTAGGIVLPDAAQDKPQRGEVVAVGAGYVKSDGDKIALTVQDGDKVLFSSYAGDEIQIGDEELLLLRESDILATF